MQYLRYVCIAAGLAAITALCEAYGLAKGLSIPGRVPGGTFGHRNMLAHFLVLGIPSTYLVAVRSRPRSAARYSSLAATAVISAAVTLTRTRAAWIAGVLCVAILLGTALPSSRCKARSLSTSGVAGWGAALLVGTGLAAVMPNALQWREPHPFVSSATRLLDYQDGSGRGRLVQYKTTLRMVSDMPLFGVGPGRWSVVYPRYSEAGDPSVPAHSSVVPIMSRPLSDWIGTAAEDGVPALAFAAAAVVLMVARHARPFLAGDPASACMIAAVCAVVILGSVDAVVLRAAPTFAIAVSLAALDRMADSATPGPATVGVVRPPMLWRVVRVGLCGLLLTTAPGVVASARALMEYSQEPTIERLSRAAQLDPTNYNVRLRLASTLVAMDACSEAVPHIRAAAHLQPYAAAPQRLLRACASRNGAPTGRTR